MGPISSKRTRHSFLRGDCQEQGGRDSLGFCTCHSLSTDRQSHRRLKSWQQSPRQGHWPPPWLVTHPTSSPVGQQEKSCSRGSQTPASPASPGPQTRRRCCGVCPTHLLGMHPASGLSRSKVTLQKSSNLQAKTIRKLLEITFVVHFSVAD